MATVQIDPRLVALAIQELPEAIAWFKSLFAKRHPDAPQPTSEEVIAAYESAFASSIAKDEAWVAAHPERPTAPPVP